MPARTALWNRKNPHYLCINVRLAHCLALRKAIRSSNNIWQEQQKQQTKVEILGASCPQSLMELPQATLLLSLCFWLRVNFQISCCFFLLLCRHFFEFLQISFEFCRQDKNAITVNCSLWGRVGDMFMSYVWNTFGVIVFTWTPVSYTHLTLPTNHRV